MGAAGIGVDGPRPLKYFIIAMDALVESLGGKLREWKPATSRIVRARVREIIQLADDGALEILRSRSVEQEVLNLIDAPSSR